MHRKLQKVMIKKYLRLYSSFPQDILETWDNNYGIITIVVIIVILIMVIIIIIIVVNSSVVVTVKVTVVGLLL